MDQGLIQTLVGLPQINVFTNNANGNLMRWIFQALNQFFPLFQPWCPGPDIEELYNLVI